VAVVIDWYSRQVVGCSMAAHLRARLVNDSLLMALWKRKHAKGLLWHTDRGNQYALVCHRLYSSNMAFSKVWVTKATVGSMPSPRVFFIPWKPRIDTPTTLPN